MPEVQTDRHDAGCIAGQRRQSVLESHSGPSWWRSPIVFATCTILLVHGSLLAVSIPDYRVTIDSAYHVSMGRDYGEHGLVAWDRINYGPGGRPNLQGPFLHAGIGYLGLMLGGRGDDYVLANSILAVVQWAAAMGTAAFFAFEVGGRIAMLLAVALLGGAGFAATSFAVGIPSGWLFIFTPWAIWFFLNQRIALASVSVALAIYSHIGGYLTAPIGIAIAALLTRRWHQGLICGVFALGLTLPYTIHVIRYARWFSGMKGHSTLLLDPMLDVLAVAGTVRLSSAPREHPFMLAWLLAPIAWIFQDPGRFFLQWPLAGSVAAGWLLANKIGSVTQTRQRIWYAIGIAALATIAPFGVPSLAGEAAWAAGDHYPLAVDWRNARNLARTIKWAGLTNSLIAHYSPTLCPAIAVYADITCEKGSWFEVQPRHDPAVYVPAAQKTYVVPLRSDDRFLASLSSAGLIAIYRNGAALTPNDTSIVRLIRSPSIFEAAMLSSATIKTEAAWLGRNAVGNAISVSNLLEMSSPSGRERFQRMLAIQRARAGRIELACLVYAWALEQASPPDALEMRQVALRVGVIASYLGDDFAVDFLGKRALAALKEKLLELASCSNLLAFEPMPSAQLMAHFNSLVYSGLGTHGNMFAGRPAGDWLPWLSG